MIFLILACARHLPAPPPDSDLLSDDPLVEQGKLSNGLSWYIQKTQEPAQRAELRLVINAGSILEDDDQLGLAHCLEHMAFNGSAHFSGNDLIHYFESIGMSFGAHVNAYTSFDETVYTLTIPTDNADALDKGLLVLRDQAGSLTLDPTEIEKERGVVLEEWRQGLNAQHRISERLLPFELHGSHYADRLPIGTPESIQKFDPAALKRFYHDWYRPDLMAVMVVGDMDPQAAQALLEKHFSDLQNPSPERERVRYPLPPHAPLSVVVDDPEVSRPAFILQSSLPDPEDRTVGNYRQGLIQQMIGSMLNERLADLSQKGADFLGAGTGWGGNIRDMGGWQLAAGLKEDKLEPGIRAILTEAERVQRFGFSEDELARTRKELLASYAAILREKDKESAQDAVEELIRVFLQGESMPGTALEVALAQKLIPDIELAEINTMASRYLVDGSLLAELILPTPLKAAAPTEAQLLEWIQATDQMALTPLTVEAPTEALMSTLPQPGKVASERSIPELGLTIWTLSNGVDVWIKPTDFAADQVLVSAMSAGGLSLIDDSDFFSASAASAIRSLSGVGALDNRSLQKTLSGHNLSGSAYISENEEGLSGESSVDDLEMMLQLLNLYVTAPRFSEEGFNRYMETTRASLQNRMVTPEARFSDAFSLLLWNNHLHVRAWSVDDLAKIDLKRAEALYKARFADADDFHWLLTGNVNLKKLKPLVERYIGSLPSLPSKESSGDSQKRMLPGVRTQILKAGLEPKAQLRLTFHGAFQNSWVNRNRLFALADVLEQQLREELREARGGVYGVQVYGNSWLNPSPEYQLSVSFTCDPERLEELKTATFAILHKVQTQPIETQIIENIKEINRRSRETDLRSNNFWLSVISNTLRNNENPLDILGWDERNNSLNPVTIQEAAKSYIDFNQYAELQLMPEG